MASDILGATAAGKPAAAPSQQAASATGKTADELSDRFLKLLVAQLNNQNPLSPLDNSKLTSQLAQINTVAGVNKLNDRLAKINGEINTSHQLQASSLIGRNVLVPGQEVGVGPKGAATAFGVNLPRAAARLDIKIVDQAGNLVHHSSYENQPAGVQSFSWDGHDAAGKVVDPGRYRIQAKALDSAGDAAPVQSLSMGYVDGVVAGQGEAPKLDLGPNGLVKLDQIYRIVGE